MGISALLLCASKKGKNRKQQTMCSTNRMKHNAIANLKSMLKCVAFHTDGYSMEAHNLSYLDSMRPCLDIQNTKGCCLVEHSCTQSSMPALQSLHQVRASHFEQTLVVIVVEKLPNNVKRQSWLQHHRCCAWTRHTDEAHTSEHQSAKSIFPTVSSSL